MCSDHVSFELKRKSKVICTQRSYKLMFIPTLCCEYDTCFFSCWNDDFACQRCSYDQMDYDEVGMKKYKFFLIKIQVGLFQNDLLYRCIYGSWQHCFWRCFFFFCWIGHFYFVTHYTLGSFCNCAFMFMWKVLKMIREHNVMNFEWNVLFAMLFASVCMYVENCCLTILRFMFFFSFRHFSTH